MDNFIKNVVRETVMIIASPFRSFFGSVYEDKEKEYRISLRICIGYFVLITAIGFFADIYNKNKPKKEEVVTKPKPKPVPFTTKFFQGEHELRRFNTRVNNKSQFSGSASYFIFGSASISGSSEQVKTVTFSWKMNDGDYGISEIELTRIRVRIDNSVETPYIKFNWSPTDVYGSIKYDMDYLIKYYVNYVLIVCKEEDYTPDVGLDEI